MINFEICMINIIKNIKYFQKFSYIKKIFNLEIFEKEIFKNYTS